MHSAQNFGVNNFVTSAFFGIEVKFRASRHKHGNGHKVTKVVPLKAVELSIGAFCTEFQHEQLCDNGIVLDRGREIDQRGQTWL